MNRINTIIFDLDGTLLDTLDDLCNSVNYALAYNKMPLRSKLEIRSFLGNGIANLMRHSVPYNTDETSFEKAFLIFRQHYVEHCLDLTQPYEGIMPLLDDLKRQGIKMAIVSNKLHPAVQELNHRFFQGYITSAVGESATVRRKPNPDAVNAALRELESKKEESLYVGDSEVDLATAKNAGMACVCVTWGFRDKDVLEKLQPDFLIDEPKDLLNIIK